jgi:hypothetical protein
VQRRIPEITSRSMGLPLTDGAWVEDRDRMGALLGWIEMFPASDGRLYTG